MGQRTSSTVMPTSPANPPAIAPVKPGDRMAPRRTSDQNRTPAGTAHARPVLRHLRPAGTKPDSPCEGNTVAMTSASDSNTPIDDRAGETACLLPGAINRTRERAKRPAPAAIGKKTTIFWKMLSTRQPSVPSSKDPAATIARKTNAKAENNARGDASGCTGIRFPSITASMRFICSDEGGENWRFSPKVHTRRRQRSHSATCSATSDSCPEVIITPSISRQVIGRLLCVASIRYFAATIEVVTLALYWIREQVCVRRKCE